MSYTLVLTYPTNTEHFTPWHPTERTGKWSRLCRGEFESEQNAHAWAQRNGVHTSTYEIKQLNYAFEQHTPT